MTLRMIPFSSGDAIRQLIPAGVAELILGDGESEGGMFQSGAPGFSTWSSQMNDFKIDTCRFLARCY